MEKLLKIVVEFFIFFCLCVLLFGCKTRSVSISRLDSLAVHKVVSVFNDTGKTETRSIRVDSNQLSVQITTDSGTVQQLTVINGHLAYLGKARKITVTGNTKSITAVDQTEQKGLHTTTGVVDSTIVEKTNKVSNSRGISLKSSVIGIMIFLLSATIAIWLLKNIKV
jgi:hypothetical protein